jgi:O-antigen chain-terminating methyltransferase
VQQKLTGLIWRVVGPYLQRQQTFNSILIDHLNRNADAQKAAHHRRMESVAALRAHLDALNVFHSRMMLYLQQITAYVDTKDRDSAGGALVLNAAISDVAEGQAKYREALAAREHRYEARASALSSAHEELRGMIGIAQQAIVALKRAVQQLNGERVGSVSTASAGTYQPVREATATSGLTPSLDAYKYVGFEDQFRGSQEVIRARQESYLPFFEHLRGGSADVLDVGCGRGEFIELLSARGIPARGIDLNHEMAELCRAKGLNVTEGDVVGYLESLPEASLAGVFAAQVVEHLEPAYLLRFLDLAFEKLQPGGVLILETLNPACWTAFFESYLRDITHRWPLHPETLKYLVTSSGFTRVAVEFRSPVPPQDRLQPIGVGADAGAGMEELSEVFNANVEKLNARMFTHMDYAVVAGKAGPADR